jgi:hypothetical protein
VRVKRMWLASIDSLQAFRNARQDAETLPGRYRAPGEGWEVGAEGLGSAIRELANRLVEEAARASEFRVRLELTEQAASTARAELRVRFRSLPNGQCRKQERTIFGKYSPLSDTP